MNDGCCAVMMRHGRALLYMHQISPAICVTHLFLLCIVYVSVIKICCNALRYELHIAEMTSFSKMVYIRAQITADAFDMRVDHGIIIVCSVLAYKFHELCGNNLRP